MGKSLILFSRTSCSSNDVSQPPPHTPSRSPAETLPCLPSSRLFTGGHSSSLCAERLTDPPKLRNKGEEGQPSPLRVGDEVEVVGWHPTPLTLFLSSEISLDATGCCETRSGCSAETVILQPPKGIGYVAPRPGWSYLFPLSLSSPQAMPSCGCSRRLTCRRSSFETIAPGRLWA